MATATVRELETNLASSYRDDIEALIGDAFVNEALRRLQDFVRDLAPDYRADALLLAHRYRHFTREVRKGLAKSDDATPIVSAILDLTEEVFGAANVATHFQLTEVDGPTPASPDTVGEPEEFPEIDMPAVEDILRDPSLLPVRSDEKIETRTGSASIHLFPQDRGSARGDETESLSQLRKTYWRRFGANRPPDQVVACIAEDIGRGHRNGGFYLGNLSFELRAGEIVGVVGRNASGKTTLLRMITGDLAPHNGHVSFPTLTKEGTSWAHIKSQIAYVPQLPEKWSGRVRENLNFAARLAGHRGKNNKEIVDWHIERYGLADYEEFTWDQLSGGYKIRFELVRSLVSQPRLLVLDEPLAYLDLIGRQEYLHNLETIATSFEQPVPIIITSQHLYEIEAVADKLIILEGGTCTFAGQLDDIGHTAERRMYEMTVQGARRSVQEVLAPLGMLSIEETMEGFLVEFALDVKPPDIFDALWKKFGTQHVSFRDVTGSARRLFKDAPVDDVHLQDPAGSGSPTN